MLDTVLNVVLYVLKAVDTFTAPTEIDAENVFPDNWEYHYG